LIENFISDLIKIGISEEKIFFKVGKIVANGGLRVGLGFEPVLIGDDNRGGHKKDYFQSQTKVVAMIKNGTNFSAN